MITEVNVDTGEVTTRGYTAEELASIAAQPAPTPVPLQATPYQFKAALIQQGLYTPALAAVNAADQLTQLAWAEAQTFIESDPHIAQIAYALGKTSADIHALFQLAGTLSP